VVSRSSRTLILVVLLASAVGFALSSTSSAVASDLVTPDGVIAPADRLQTSSHVGAGPVESFQHRYDDRPQFAPASARPNGYALAPRAIRPVGAALESVDDVLTNPHVLHGMKPAQVETMIGNTAGWRLEALGQGDHAGQGWLLRQYTDAGEPTGRMIRWHPGGGRHGPDPYWRVTSGEGGKSPRIAG
jgi:hypothetical protein